MPDRTDLVNEVTAVITGALEALGKSADEMAASLERLGAKGVMGDDQADVLSRHLRARLEERFPVRVTFVSVDMPVLVEVDSVEIDVEVPEHVEDFYVAFDAGNYPALVEEES